MLWFGWLFFERIMYLLVLEVVLFILLMCVV